MTGSDVQMWNRVLEKIKGEKLSMDVLSDGFRLSGIGVFETVENLYNYLCGYETGLTKGEVKGYKMGFKDGERQIRK